MSSIKIKNNSKKLKKFIKFIKKDLAKGLGIKQKYLFGSDKKIEKYNKKKVIKK